MSGVTMRNVLKGLYKFLDELVQNGSRFTKVN